MTLSRAILPPTFTLGAMILTLGAVAPAAAQAKSISHVPHFNVSATCNEARKFSTGEQKDNDYRGCLADEGRAKAELEKVWSSLKAADKSQCVEEGPDPSYVELQTCLQLDVDKKIGATQVPQIGGPVAPGLTPNK